MEKTNNSHIRIIIILVAIVVLVAVIGGIAFSNSAPQKLKKQLDLGQKYLNELNYEAVVTAFKAAIGIDEFNDTARQGLAQAYTGWSGSLAEAGDYDQAIARLQEAISVLPDNNFLKYQLYETYLQWSAACLEDRDYDSSMNAIENAIDMLPDDGLDTEYLVLVCIELAHELAEAEDYQKAISILQKTYDKTGDSRLKDLINQYEVLQEEKLRAERIKNKNLSDFSDLIQKMDDIPYYRQLGGYSEFLSFEDRKKDYMPLIEETEEYIEYLNLSPIDGLCAHDFSGEVGDYPYPADIVYIGTYYYPKLGDAYAILAHYYMRIGDMEKSYEIRKVLADYIGNDAILSDHHRIDDESDSFYDSYGRTVEFDGVDGSPVYQIFTERGNGLLSQTDAQGRSEHTYDEDGRLLSYRDNRDTRFDWTGWSVSYSNGKAYLEGVSPVTGLFSIEYTILKYGYGQSTEYLQQYHPEAFYR